MLVLSRKPGERILIGPDVVVTLVRIGPSNVRLGIEAPRTLNIVREELTVREATAALVASRQTGDAVERLSELENIDLAAAGSVTL